LTDIYLQLFCDDAKSAEIALIDHGVDYAVGAAPGFRGERVDVLSLSLPCAELATAIGLHLMIYDHDDLRGALKPDAQGRVPRGDFKAVQRLMLEDVA
jgi:hypothetical protein